MLHGVDRRRTECGRVAAAAAGGGDICAELFGGGGGAGSGWSDSARRLSGGARRQVVADFGVAGRIDRAVLVDAALGADAVHGERRVFDGYAMREGWTNGMAATLRPRQLRCAPETDANSIEMIKVERSEVRNEITKAPGRVVLGTIVSTPKTNGSCSSTSAVYCSGVREANR